jgi:Fe-S cluster assembly protein SufD
VGLKNENEKMTETKQTLPMPNLKYGKTVMIDLSAFNSENAQRNTEQDITIQAPEHTTITKIDNKNPYFMSLFQPEHSLSELHAHHATGSLITIPKDTTAHITITRTAKDSTYHHLIIIAEENTTATITEELTSTNTNQIFTSNAVEIIAKPHANVTFTSIQNYNKETYNFDYKYAQAAENATVNWNDIQLGSTFTKTENNTFLTGHHSTTERKDMFFGDTNQQFDILATATHASPHTTSNIISKGILNNTAKAIYRGIIKINKNAPNSSGHQKEDTLLLSPTTEADTIPQLEIDNNDVKCSHAATISQIEDAKLFYFTSRGISKETAKKMLVAGFVDPLIIQTLTEDHANQIKTLVEDRL